MGETQNSSSAQEGADLSRMGALSPPPPQEIKNCWAWVLLSKQFSHYCFMWSPNKSPNDSTDYHYTCAVNGVTQPSPTSRAEGCCAYQKCSTLNNKQGKWIGAHEHTQINTAVTYFSISTRTTNLCHSNQLCTIFSPLRRQKISLVKQHLEQDKAIVSPLSIIIVLNYSIWELLKTWPCWIYYFLHFCIFKIV